MGIDHYMTINFGKKMKKTKPDRNPITLLLTPVLTIIYSEYDSMNIYIQKKMIKLWKYKLIEN